MSRIAFAWISESLNFFIRPVLAVSTSRDALINSHDSVDVVQRNDVALENMRSLLRLIELELRATNDHDVAVGDEVLQGFGEREDPRSPFNEREHIHPEGGLHLGVSVEIVEHHVGIRVPPKLDDDPKAVPVRFIANVGDIIEFLVVDHVGDLLDEAGLVHLVRDLVTPQCSGDRPSRFRSTHGREPRAVPAR